MKYCSGFQCSENLPCAWGHCVFFLWLPGWNQTCVPKTSRKYFSTFSFQCFLSNSLPKVGPAKWVFVDGVQIVLPKGVILSKPVKKVPGQTELPNLQTHTINLRYVYICYKNQLNILLGKYTIHWSYMDFMRNSTVLASQYHGYHPPSARIVLQQLPSWQTLQLFPPSRRFATTFQVGIW